MLSSEGDSDCERFDDDDDDLFGTTNQFIEKNEDEVWDEELGTEFFQNPDYKAMEDLMVVMAEADQDTSMTSDADFDLGLTVYQVVQYLVEEVTSTSVSDGEQLVRDMEFSEETFDDDEPTTSMETDSDNSLQLFLADDIERRIATTTANSLGVPPIVTNTYSLFVAVDRFLQEVCEWNALDNLDCLESMISIHADVLLKVSKLLFNKQVLWTSTMTASSEKTVKRVPELIKNTHAAIPTPGDGSCFFNSVSFTLFGSFDYSDVIRAGAIIIVKKYYSRVKDLMTMMGVESLKSIAISVKVRERIGLRLVDSFNTRLCPVLVSAATNAPVVVIEAFSRDTLNMFPTDLGYQERKLVELVRGGFTGIMMYSASEKIQLHEPITMLYEDGNHYTCLMRKNDSNYGLDTAHASAAFLY